MKTKGRRMSNNYEVVKGDPITPPLSAERDKAPVKDWDGRLGGAAGQEDSAKRLSQLQDSAKPTKLTDGVYPKPYKQTKTYADEVKAAKADRFKTEFD